MIHSRDQSEIVHFLNLHVRICASLLCFADKRTRIIYMPAAHLLQAYKLNIDKQLDKQLNKEHSQLHCNTADH